MLFRVDSVLDPWAFHLKVSGSEIITMPDGSNVRKTIIDVLHRLQIKLLRDDEGDTKSFRSIIHVSMIFQRKNTYQNLIFIQIYNVILFNKTRGHDFELHWKSFHITKKLLEDRLHQKKLHLRSVLIDRVVLQQEFRVESRNCSFTETHKQILLDLFDLSISRYSEVKKLPTS